MREDVKIKRQWSIRTFRDIVFPAMIKEEWIPIGTVIYKDESELDKEDKLGGIDCLLNTPSGNLISLAIRIQDSDENLYDSFTVRAELVSGARTEFIKRKEAIEKKYVRPDKVLQAYVSKKTNRLDSMFMMNQEDLIEYIENGIEGLDYKTKIAPDGNKFYVVFIVSLIKYSINIFKRKE